MKLPDYLETEHLVLRRWKTTDAKDILEYVSLPEVAYPAGFLPVTTLAEEVAYLANDYPRELQSKNLPGGYGLTVKGVDKIIGSIDFNHRLADDILELGYLLHPDYWGQGLMVEASRAFLSQAFSTLPLHKVELECYDYNHASKRVAEKLGFRLEATLRDRKDIRGERCNLLRYGILKREWEGEI